ncbi:Ig-like domain-containing protein [Jatrophihabitans telluris]|uniref:Ig-like domain-containing protein n=1 Tax=Jatrophihabitans telluris TaxID=2038343 RepID=A0ABY4QZH5_9ACTN|nr:Ig-like domain-containing protein [Jatrophihabitans telluris]UQX88401.1 Ig-like domain-containing protein [Jatrophihabitans telluris]
MKVNFTSALSGAGALAIAGGLLLAGASAASAAAPTYEPDPNSVGTVTLYDASGAQLTSGSLSTHPFATYYAGSGGATPHAPANSKATPLAYIPQDGVNPASWSGDSLGPSTTYGTAASAAYPAPLTGSANAIAKAGSTDFSMDDILNEFTLSSSLNPNVVEIRVATGNNGEYYNMDVKVDTTAGTWTQVYPVVAAKVGTAISAITASPASPAPSSTTSVNLTATLSATDSTHPAGSVHLFDGTTDLGAATLNAGTGAISATATVATSGSYGFKFVYTASGNYNNSSSAVLAYSVTGPAAATTTVVSGPTTGTVGTPVTYTAAVSASSGTPTGSVQFTVDGSNLGAPVSVANAASTGVQYTPADTSPHVIKASYTPASGANFSGSSDTTGITLTATAAANAPDPQTVTVTVPAGSLVISTPYTPANPLDLGTLKLAADGTSLSTTPVNFGDPSANAAADPGNGPTASTTNGVTVTDTRPGSTGWSASASTSDFTSGTNSIDGNDLAFTGVTPKYLSGNHVTSVTTNDISAFKTPKSFASTTQGPGTVNIYGKMGLSNVSTSTLPGTYTATVTFTIV